MPLALERDVDRVVAVSRSAPDPSTIGGAEWRALDLVDAVAVRSLFVEVEPTAVISAAATNPGQGDTFAVNEVGAAAVARACSLIGARLVHVSSDIVHDGRLAPDAPGYADAAAPTPINAYGESKAAGERAVLAALPSASVVRTSLIYGIASIDRGTAGFIERLDRGERLSLWGDAIRQPVWIDALSTALLDLALEHTNVSGPINVAGGEAMSRAEFARRLLAHWGVDARDRIDVTRAAELDDQPLDLRLDLGRARSLGLPLPGVSEVLLAGD